MDGQISVSFRDNAKAFFKSIAALTLLGGCWGSVALGQVRMIEGFNNVYSPHLEYVGGRLKMYYGGWQSGTQVRDTIYRADCPEPHRPCKAERPVVFWQSGRWAEVPDFLLAINDPTIVNMGHYLIMYFTACPIWADCMKVPWDHGIYMSVSWAHDGIHWSTPTRILNGYWLPSVTKKSNGEILLYANRGYGGLLEVFNLGRSGASVLSRQSVRVSNSAYYINVEVRYFASINLFQMLGEPLGSHASIDYLHSYDGVRFELRHPRIIGPAPGHVKARTPAMHPVTAAYVYYGSTAEVSGLANQVHFATW